MTLHTADGANLPQEPISLDERVCDVSFCGDKFRVALRDGRSLSVPIRWYPRLLAATPEQRTRWRVSDDGWSVLWDTIDEEISTEELLWQGPSNHEGNKRVEQDIRALAADEALNSEALEWIEAVVGDVAEDSEIEGEIVAKAVVWAEEILEKYS
jgi:hypothetical protein